VPLQCYSWQCHSNLYIFNNNNNNWSSIVPHKRMTASPQTFSFIYLYSSLICLRSSRSRQDTRAKPALIHKDCQYLVSDLDKQGKNDDDEQVVKNANSSHDDVDNLECKVTDVHQIQLHIIIFRRRERREVPDISRQRCVLHRCQEPSPSPASAIYRL